MARFFNWQAWNRDQFVTGTEHRDFIVTRNGDDEITALGGNDWIFAGRGYNTIDAGDGDDFVLTLWDGSSIAGGLGDDRISALGGSNKIDAGDGDDRVRTGWGDDHIVGGGGNDNIRAGGGDDTIEGGLGSDYLDGGWGNDTALFSGQFADYDFQITGWNRATVTSLGNGDIDKVRRIEALEFDDAFVHIRGRSFEVEYKDTNAAPTAIALDNNTVVENSDGAAVGRLAVTDPDDDAHSFVVSDDRFEVVAGELRLKTGETLDFETEPSISLDVIATDAGGLSFTETFLITVNNLAEAPSDIALDNNTVVENSDGAAVGRLAVTDPDDDTHSFAVSDDRFEVVAGELRLKAGETLDFETEPSISLDVIATDAGGLSFTETFLITVNNLAEAPSDIALSNGTVNENSAIETVVGIFSVVDPEGDSTLSLTDDAGGLFEIFGNELRVAGHLDAETAASHTVTVLATDQGGGTYAEAFLITVNNVSDTPPVALAQSLATNEGAVMLGTLQATDADGDPVDFALVGGSEVGGVINLDTDTGNFSFALAEDFSGITSFQFVASDGTDTSEPETVTIDVAPVADVPALEVELTSEVDIKIDVALSDTDGSETISRVVLSDFPEGAEFSLGALDEDPTSPTFDAWVIDDLIDVAALASGPLTMTPPVDYDGSFTLTVEAVVTDMATLSDSGVTLDTVSATRNLDITVTPANRAPVAADDAVTGDEDTEITGNVLDDNGAGADSDPDGDPLFVDAYSVGFPGGGSFSIDTEGNFTFMPTENFSGTESVTYTLRDGFESDTGTITFTVNAVADTPSLALEDSTEATTADEDADLALPISGLAFLDGSETGTVTVSGMPASFRLTQGTDNGDGTWTLTESEANSANIVPAADWNGSFELSVTATATEPSNGDTASVTDTVAMIFNPVNDEPEGEVMIAGTAAVDETLAADISALSDADGFDPEIVSYHWESSSDGTIFAGIAGETASELLLSETLVGQQVRVVVTYQDSGGTTETVESAATTVSTIGLSGTLNPGVISLDLNDSGYDTTIGADGVEVFFSDENGYLAGSSADFDGINGFKVTYDKATYDAELVTGGDLNGDGIDDLVMASAASADVHVIFGSSIGYTAEIDVTEFDGTDGFAITGLATDLDGTAGELDMTVGDVDGDSIDDLLINQTYTINDDSGGTETVSETRVVLGNNTGDFTALTNLNDFGTGVQSYTLTNTSDPGAERTTTIIDYNDDDTDDIVLGIEGTASGDIVYLIDGGADLDSDSDGVVDIADLDSDQYVTIVGAEGDDEGIADIASVGDVTGDDLSDLVITTGAGDAYLVDGTDLQSGSQIELTNSDITFTNVSGGVSGGGDLNADGVNDLTALDRNGNAVVIFGGGFLLTQPTRPLLDAAASGMGLVAEDALGAPIFLGDTNGDGFDDVSVDGVNGATLIAGYDVNSEGAFVGDETANTYTGDATDEIIFGAGAGDTLHGKGGDDRIVAGTGDDDLHGGSGNDRLEGGIGIDQLFGEEGADLLFGDHGDDSLDGGNGADRLEGGRGNDYLIGGKGKDRLLGGSGDDQLEGRDGNDRLVGGTGNDTLEGGEGNDVLVGGPGIDALTGGLGEDVFIFRVGHGQVTITDFDPGPQGPGTIVDQIKFKGFGPQLNFAALDSNADGLINADDADVAGSGAPNDPLTLSFGIHDTLIITDIPNLTQDDVLFT